MLEILFVERVVDFGAHLASRRCSPFSALKQQTTHSRILHDFPLRMPSSNQTAKISKLSSEESAPALGRGINGLRLCPTTFPALILRPAIVAKPAVQPLPHGFRGILAPRSDYFPSKARALARISVSSSSDTFPFRRAERARQSSDLT